MSPLLKRATDQTQSEWLPVPEGTWRWMIGTPEVKWTERYNNYQVKFPLQLTRDEQSRVLEETGKPPEGITQSYHVSYTVGLSLGYVQRDGQYKSTKLVDFIAASLGREAGKKFREWIASGGGPPRPNDLNDQKAELEAIADWLRWFEGMEIYGTVTHRAASDGSDVIYSNFSGPLPVGSLPGQREDEYQARGRGKLKAIITESGDTREQHARDTRMAEAVAVGAASNAPPPQRYDSRGEPVSGDGSDELPWN